MDSSGVELYEPHQEAEGAASLTGALADQLCGAAANDMSDTETGRPVDAVAPLARATRRPSAGRGRTTPSSGAALLAPGAPSSDAALGAALEALERTCAAQLATVGALLASEPLRASPSGAGTRAAAPPVFWRRMIAATPRARRGYSEVATRIFRGRDVTKIRGPPTINEEALPG